MRAHKSIVMDQLENETISIILYWMEMLEFYIIRLNSAVQSGGIH